MVPGEPQHALAHRRQRAAREPHHHRQAVRRRAHGTEDIGLLLIGQRRGFAGAAAGDEAGDALGTIVRDQGVQRAMVHRARRIV